MQAAFTWRCVHIVTAVIPLHCSCRRAPVMRRAIVRGAQKGSYEGRRVAATVGGHRRGRVGAGVGGPWEWVQARVLGIHQSSTPRGPAARAS